MADKYIMLAEETGREFALRAIRDSIVRAEFKPAEILSEQRIATQLNLSRTPVREALIELSRSKIVEILPKRGSRVALIDTDILEEEALIRVALERAIIPDLCAKATYADFDEFERLIGVLEQQAGPDNDVKDLLKADDAFHEYMYRICNRMRCFNLAFTSNIHFERYRHLRLHLVSSLDVAEEHRVIVEAIRGQDVRLVRDLLERHVLRYIQDINVLREKYPGYFK